MTPQQNTSLVGLFDNRTEHLVSDVHLNFINYIHKDVRYISILANQRSGILFSETIIALLKAADNLRQFIAFITQRDTAYDFLETRKLTGHIDIRPTLAARLLPEHYECWEKHFGILEFDENGFSLNKPSVSLFGNPVSDTEHAMSFQVGFGALSNDKTICQLRDHLKRTAMSFLLQDKISLEYIASLSPTTPTMRVTGPFAQRLWRNAHTKGNLADIGIKRLILTDYLSGVGNEYILG